MGKQTWTLTDIPIRQGIDLERWDEMSWGAKHRHIAYQHALDTMQAWETMGDKERREAIARWRTQRAKED